MARCGSGHLYCRVADRGNEGGASDLFNHEVEQPQRLAWLTPGLGAVEWVGQLQHLVPGLGLVSSSTGKETEPVKTVKDELIGNEEHPSNGDIIYDYPPVYDEYEDEDWYFWITGVNYDPTGKKKGESDIFIHELTSVNANMHEALIVQFHIRLLSLIEEDFGRKCSKKSNGYDGLDCSHAWKDFEIDMHGKLLAWNGEPDMLRFKSLVFPGGVEKNDVKWSLLANGDITVLFQIKVRGIDYVFNPGVFF